MSNEIKVKDVVGGVPVATEKIPVTTGKDYQRIKFVLGAINVDDGDVSTANPMPVTGSVTVTGGGDATAANQTAGNTLIGAVNEAAPGTDTASSGLNGRLQRIAQRVTSLIALIPAALTGSGNFKVAVQEAIPAGTNNIGDVDVLSSALPTGAATSAKQDTALVYLASLQGTVTAGGTAIQVRGNSADSTNQAVVTAATSTTELRAANSSRIGIMIWNNSTAILYVKIGSSAAIATADFPIHPGERWEPFVNPLEVINGIWSAANGAAHVTEFIP